MNMLYYVRTIDYDVYAQYVTWKFIKTTGNISSSSLLGCCFSQNQKLGILKLQAWLIIRSKK